MAAIRMNICRGHIWVSRRVRISASAIVERPSPALLFFCRLRWERLQFPFSPLHDFRRRMSYSLYSPSRIRYVVIAHHCGRWLYARVRKASWLALHGAAWMAKALHWREVSNAICLIYLTAATGVVASRRNFRFPKSSHIIL